MEGGTWDENAEIGRRCGSGLTMSLDGIPPWKAKVGG